MPAHRSLRHQLRDVRLAREAVVRLRLLARRPVASDGVLFLFYHAMRPGERGQFARQLRRLRDHGDLIALSDAVALLAAGGGRGERRICITFDDGARSAYDHALPILAEQGVPAAFFIVPGWIDEARAEIVGWDDCRRIAQAGMEVGSHSLTHRRLATLDAAKVASDLAAARERIEAELGRPCRHCACPWGQPDVDYLPEREPTLARAAGYRSFFTTVAQRAQPGADPWSLPRVRMEPGWGRAEIRYALLR